MEELKLNVFDQFDKKWALLTAGTPDSFNTMTISWGGFGTLWSKPVTTVYVKPVRYTYEFMEKNEYFTVSFFPEEYKKDLALLGSKSGRDGDKLALTSLTPVELEHGIGFREAELTVICRKIYRQDLDGGQIPAEAAERYYQTEPVHRMYIGEVLAITKQIEC